MCNIRIKGGRVGVAVGHDNTSWRYLCDLMGVRGTLISSRADAEAEFWLCSNRHDFLAHYDAARLDLDAGKTSKCRLSQQISALYLDSFPPFLTCHVWQPAGNVCSMQSRHKAFEETVFLEVAAVL